ncbi:hypothetical protein [Carp edema virus]|nr:hypothetical protein [Carp edema virus]
MHEIYKNSDNVFLEGCKHNFPSYRITDFIELYEIRKKSPIKDPEEFMLNEVNIIIGIFEMVFLERMNPLTRLLFLMDYAKEFYHNDVDVKEPMFTTSTLSQDWDYVVDGLQKMDINKDEYEASTILNSDSEEDTKNNFDKTVSFNSNIGQGRQDKYFEQFEKTGVIKNNYLEFDECDIEISHNNFNNDYFEKDHFSEQVNSQIESVVKRASSQQDSDVENSGETELDFEDANMKKYYERLISIKRSIKKKNGYSNTISKKRK